MTQIPVYLDIQNDFVPGGALAVREGDRVVPVANGLMGRFEVVVATQDWHPADHGSFAANHPGKRVGDVIELNGLPQVLWPVHCVQGTHGAEFVPGLAVDQFNQVFRKGTDAEIDSYSGFFDNGHRRHTIPFAHRQRPAARHKIILNIHDNQRPHHVLRSAYRLLLRFQN